MRAIGAARAMMAPLAIAAVAVVPAALGATPANPQQREAIVAAVRATHSVPLSLSRPVLISKVHAPILWKQNGSKLQGCRDFARAEFSNPRYGSLSVFLCFYMTIDRTRWHWKGLSEGTSCVGWDSRLEDYGGKAAAIIKDLGFPCVS